MVGIVAAPQSSSDAVRAVDGLLTIQLHRPCRCDERVDEPGFSWPTAAKGPARPHPSGRFLPLAPPEQFFPGNFLRLQYAWWTRRPQPTLVLDVFVCPRCADRTVC